MQINSYGIVIEMETKPYRRLAWWIIILHSLNFLWALLRVMSDSHYINVIIFTYVCFAHGFLIVIGRFLMDSYVGE